MNAHGNHAGANSSDDADVVIVGGGLAGLATALFIARSDTAVQSGRRVRLVERRSRLGGMAVTDERDGFLFNRGPHALYTSGAGAPVLRELGIEMKGGKPPAKGRIVIDGKAHIAPSGPITLARTKALNASEKFEVAKLLAKLPKFHPSEYAKVSVSTWIRDAAKHDRSRAMLHGLCRLATYVNNPDELSAEVAIEQLQYGLGPGVLYLDGGWQSLVDQMVATLEALPNVTVETGVAIEELPDAPVVVIAAGGPALAARLLDCSFDVGPPADASCFDLGLSQAPEHDLVIGADVPFYFSNHSAVADLAPSGQFHAAVVEYLAPGAEPRPDAIEAFTQYAGVEQNDVMTSRHLHRMTTVSAIATAEHGGLAGRPPVVVPHQPGVFVAGDWVGPDGHLADASLASAKQAAKAAIAHLGQLAPASAGR